MDAKERDGISELYSDGNYLFIHKPPGIPFHSEEGVRGFVSLVKERYPDQSLYPVHRLDKVTSGVMVFARNENANKALSTAFERREVSKCYLAISDRKPSKKQGWIKGDMCKARNGSYRLTREMSNPAITRFRFHAIVQNTANIYLAILVPKTGKTHQLRVAMKALASPILGDARYGGHDWARTCLHAYRLSFECLGRRYDVTDSQVGVEVMEQAISETSVQKTIEALFVA